MSSDLASRRRLAYMSGILGNREHIQGQPSQNMRLLAYLNRESGQQQPQQREPTGSSSERQDIINQIEAVKSKLPPEKEPPQDSKRLHRKRFTGDPDSIVDWLKQRGMPSDFASRARLAQERGILEEGEQFIGSAEQNMRLLASLNRGITEQPTSTSEVDNSRPPGNNFR